VKPLILEQIGKLRGEANGKWQMANGKWQRKAKSRIHADEGGYALSCSDPGPSALVPQQASCAFAFHPYVLSVLCVRLFLPFAICHLPSF
jgi:hypothetical protein